MLENQDTKKSSEGRMLPEFVAAMIDDYFVLYDGEFWSQLKYACKLAQINGSSVVDIGSGPGIQLSKFVRTFSAGQGTGLDSNQEMVSFANNLPLNEAYNIRYVVADVNSGIPIKGVDVIMAHRLVHSLQEPNEFFSDVRMSHTKGGYLIISDWLKAPIEEYRRAVFRNPALSDEKLQTRYKRFSKYSADDLKALCVAHGYEPIGGFLFKAVMQCLVAKLR